MSEEGRRWAKCEICGMTTDPESNLPFEDETVIVEKEGGRFSLMHKHCIEDGFPTAIHEYL